MKRGVGVVLAVSAVVLLAAGPSLGYYHPTLGRWVARDPARYADGCNLCEYSLSRPTNERDPLGDRIKEFICCSDEEQTALQQANDSLERRMPFIMGRFSYYSFERVQAQFMDPNARYGDAQKKWRDAYVAFHNSVSANLEKIAEGLRDGITVKCHSNWHPNCAIYGYDAFRYFGGAKIHICPSYFGRDLRTQAATIMHEASHLFASTMDLNWSWLGQSDNNLGLAWQDAYLYYYLYLSDIDGLMTTDILPKQFPGVLRPRVGRR